MEDRRELSDAAPAKARRKIGRSNALALASAAAGALALTALMVDKARHEAAYLKESTKRWHAREAREAEAERFLEQMQRVRGEAPHLTVRTQRASRARNHRLLVEALEAAEPACTRSGYGAPRITGATHAPSGEFENVDITCGR